MSTVRVSAVGVTFHTFWLSQTRDRVRAGRESSATNSRCSIMVRATGRPSTEVRSRYRVSTVMGPAVITVIGSLSRRREVASYPYHPQGLAVGALLSMNDEAHPLPAA